MPVSMSNRELAHLATQLRSIDPLQWGADDLRRVVAELGWEWKGREEPGSRELLGAGLSTGDAWARPVGDPQSYYVDREEYIEIGAYVHRLDQTARTAHADHIAPAHAEAFRAAADTLVHTDGLGHPTTIGDYHLGSRFDGGIPGWGAPYMRWDGRFNTLELSAGVQGPELVLVPTEPLVTWFAKKGVNGMVHDLDGFIGVAPMKEGGGPLMPPVVRAADWDEFARSLGGFLFGLPRVTQALGVRMVIFLSGHVPDKRKRVLFDIAAEPAGVELAVEHEKHLGADPVADYVLPTLGWVPVSQAPPALDHICHEDGAFHSGPPANSAEETGRLTRMLVDTFRAMGIASPLDLSFGDGSFELQTSCTAEPGPEYYVQYYGLSLG